MAERDNMLREIKSYFGQNNATNKVFDILENGIVVGGLSICIYDDDEEPGTLIDYINVDEQYRNRGYGSRAIMEIADQYGPCYLAPDNEDARRLYERLGEEDLEDDGWG